MPGLVGLSGFSSSLHDKVTLEIHSSNGNYHVQTFIGQTVHYLWVQQATNGRPFNLNFTCLSLYSFIGKYTKSYIHKTRCLFFKFKALEVCASSLGRVMYAESLRNALSFR